jgi:hypothetical protein
MKSKDPDQDAGGGLLKVKRCDRHNGLSATHPSFARGMRLRCAKENRCRSGSRCQSVVYRLIKALPFTCTFRCAAHLEPVKPVAAFLIGTGQIAAGVTVLTVGEILKLVIVERLFKLCRRKLLKIPLFAWLHESLAGCPTLDPEGQLGRSPCH